MVFVVDGVYRYRLCWVWSKNNVGDGVGIFILVVFLQHLLRIILSFKDLARVSKKIT